MASAEQLIVIDFDHTVFNTTPYVEAQIDRFDREFGISRKDFLTHREAVKDCCVVIDIDTFVLRLPHDDKEAMHEALHDVIRSHASEFTYSDATSFVERHMDDFDVMLLTHGDTELQTEKIKHSGLPQGLPFTITQDEKTDLLKDYVGVYETVFFIDDKAVNIRSVEETLPEVVTYLMRRPGDQPYAADQDAESVADYMVTGLGFTIEADVDKTVA